MKQNETKRNETKPNPHLFSHWNVEVHWMVLSNPDKFLSSGSLFLVFFQELQHPPYISQAINYS